MRATSLDYLTRLVFMMCISAGIAFAQAGDAVSPPPLGKLVDVGSYRVHLYCLAGVNTH
jgi:hypothetical protein